MILTWVYLGPNDWLACDDSDYVWNLVEKSAIIGCVSFHFDVQKADGSQNKRIKVGASRSSTEYETSDSPNACIGGGKC